MKYLNNYINEKLHISNYKQSEVENIKEDIIEMISTFCTLFYNVNGFFTDKSMKEMVSKNEINTNHINEVIESLLYFFKRGNNTIGVELIEKYPKENRDDINQAIIEGIKKYLNKKK